MHLTDTSNDKRRFTRVPFVTHISLSHNEQLLKGSVVDISFNGALLHFDTDLTIDKQTIFSSTIYFENDSNIHADLKLVHRNNQFYGFCFSEIDSDSLTYLRNIISLNLGDANACERELMSLFSYHQ